MMLESKMRFEGGQNSAYPPRTKFANYILQYQIALIQPNVKPHHITQDVELLVYRTFYPWMENAVVQVEQLTVRAEAMTGRSKAQPSASAGYPPLHTIFIAYLFDPSDTPEKIV